MKRGFIGALRLSVAFALLAGCGGSQPPIGTPYPNAAPSLTKALRSQSSEKVIYSFAGGSDGSTPEAAPIVIDGELYGTTVLGGNGGCIFVHGCGTIYKVNASGQERVLHVFKSGTDGEAPVASLIDGSETLFGTTVLGGGSGCKNHQVKVCGTVFELTRSGKERVRYRFPGKAQGALPAAPLTLFNGTIYGEAAAGGTGACYYTNQPGCGLIFKMNSSGGVSIVYTFSGGKSGGTPQGGLVPFKGNFYGTTSAGGGNACLFSYGCGTVFRMTPSGSVTVLHQFGHRRSDPAAPETGLVVLNGTLYGTTFSGGASDCAYSGSGFGCGTVFEVTLSGEEKTIYNFKGVDDGAYPSGLIAIDGSLYGAAGGRGSHQCGTVFKVTPSGKFTILYEFNSGADGCGPSSGLIDVGGTLYGTTGGGGQRGDGTVYSITP